MPAQNTATPSRDEPLKALAWMTLSGVGFSLMSLVIKTLIPHVPGFELVFFRSLINMSVILVLLGMSGRLTRAVLFPRKDRRVLIIRGIAGFAGLSCWFWALHWLPLSIASMLNWCAPIFTILFSALFIGERVKPAKLVWVACSFAALLAILRINPLELAAFHLPWIGVIIGLSGAAFAGVAYSAVRVMASRVSTHVIVLYFVGLATFVSFPLALWDWHWPDVSQWVLIAVSGMCATVAQMAMTQAYRYAPAATVSTMGLMSAGLSVVWGAVFLGESFVLVQWIGMAVLAVSLGLLTAQKTG